MLTSWFFILCTVLSSFVHIVFSQNCQCDLTTHQCDINCCCDGDCDVDDRLAFSYCTPQKPNRIEQVCKSDVLLYAANGKYSAQGNDGGMFCIYKDNYAARHSFSNIPLVSTQSSFEKLANQHQRNNLIPDTTTSSQYLNTLKAGDVMFILFDNGQQGYLPQPSTFITNQCKDNNPARFLFTNLTSCYRLVEELSSECESSKIWSSETYVNGFQVAPYPSFLEESVSVSNNASSMTTVNNVALITPTVRTPLQCMKNGVVDDCTFTNVQPPSLVNGQCENVILQVHYHISYNINITVEISKVDISFVFGSLPANTSAFQQMFSFQFSQNKSLGTNVTASERSGNPGYVVGLPVVSGTVQKDPITEIETVYMNEESDMFAVLKPTNDGSCSNESHRERVDFGVNYQAACFFSFNASMTTSQCKKLQEDIFTVFFAKLPTKVASFGNSAGDQLNDWVDVIYEQPTLSAAESNGQCYGIVTDVALELLYAKSGYVANPQNKIVGVQVEYGKARNLLFQCAGLLCQQNRVIVTQSVSFVDVSSTPQTEIKPKPKFRSKAPDDFFYPFL